jgi:hypothetical protein
MRGLWPAIVLVAACASIDRSRAISSPPADLAPQPEAPPHSDPALTAEGQAATPESPTASARRSRAESLEHFRRGVGSVSFEVQVHPPDRTEIAGFVLSRDGKPVDRACVELVGSSRPAPVFTSTQGDFRFTAVPPGIAKVTITVADTAPLAQRRIADHHDQDPNLTVLVRPLVLSPPTGRLTVLRIKRQGGMPGQDESHQWMEVAPIALDLEGYSAACRQALRGRGR